MNHNIDLPPRIAQLPKDHRGYPVPHIVMRDENGKPLFAMNDLYVVQEAVKDNLCHICGQELDPNPWFTGGPGSALLNGNHAAYFDGPMHYECMEFALRVCPYLTGRQERFIAATLEKKMKARGSLVLEEPNVLPGMPDVFMAVQAHTWSYNGRNFLVPRPVKKTQYWLNGQMLPKDDGERMAKKAARVLKVRLKEGG